MYGYGYDPYYSGMPPELAYPPAPPAAVGYELAPANYHPSSDYSRLAYPSRAPVRPLPVMPSMPVGPPPPVPQAPMMIERQFAGVVGRHRGGDSGENGRRQFGGVAIRKHKGHTHMDDSWREMIDDDRTFNWSNTVNDVVIYPAKKTQMWRQVGSRKVKPEPETRMEVYYPSGYAMPDPYGPAGYGPPPPPPAAYMRR